MHRKCFNLDWLPKFRAFYSHESTGFSFSPASTVLFQYSFLFTYLVYHICLHSTGSNDPKVLNYGFYSLATRIVSLHFFSPSPCLSSPLKKYRCTSVPFLIINTFPLVLFFLDLVFLFFRLHLWLSPSWWKKLVIETKVVPHRNYFS